MPDSAVVSALRSLLPSLPASNKPFPPLLISQCESLLTLSRQRASNLKPEEEIARAHACAEIACSRLRAQLRLPAIKNGAGAPCQPRTYAKLLKFLEGAIGDAATGSLTPRGRKRDSEGIVKDTQASGNVKRSATKASGTLGIEDTPSKKGAGGGKIGTAFVGTIKSKFDRKKGGDSAIDDKSPDFVMPSIRTLCKIFSTPTLAPHVYTGTCVVLNLAGIWSTDTEMNQNLRTDILALITALYLMVLTRMQEDQMTTEVYTEVLNKSVETFGLGDQLSQKVEEWIDRLNEEEWCSGEEWWDSVPESVLAFDPKSNRAEQDNVVAEEDDVLGGKSARARASAKRTDLDVDDPEGALLPGLGTMLHDGIDWTSKDKGLDFEEWHNSLMKRMETPVKAGARKSKAIAVN